MPGLGIGIGVAMGVGRPKPSPFDLVRQALFSAGEQGIYMPSVHESFVRGDLFQDVLGTTPVTAVGQSVGLWLDRSKGLVLGPELITNGDFSDGTTGWTPTQATILVTNGELETTSTFSNWGQAGRSVNLTPGRSYVLSGYVRKGTAGQRASVDIYDGEAQFTAINTSSGEASGAIVFVAKGAGGCVIKLNSWVTAIGQKSYFDNISLREISGNHASQPTAASRPILQQDANGMYVLRFDGVDDSMATASIPGGVGASLLVGMCDNGTVDAWANVVSWGLGTNTAPFVGLGRMNATEDATTRVDAEDSPGPGFNVTNQLVGGFDGSSHVISASYGEARRVCIDREIAAGTGMPEPLDMTGFAGSIAIGGVSNGYTGKASMDVYGLIVCGVEKSLAQIEQAEDLINKYARAY